MANKKTLQGRLAAAGVVGAAALLASGCAQTKKIQGLTPSEESQRLANAQRLALQAQEAKKPEKAIALYQQAIRQFPGLGPAWNNLGVLLMESHDFLGASEAFAAAADSSPRDPRPLYNLGLTWDRAGYLEDARRHYIDSLRRDERYLPALRGVIRAEGRLGTGDDSSLDRIRMAIAQEADDRWRLYFELQRTRVEFLVYKAAGMTPPGARRSAGADRAPGGAEAARAALPTVALPVEAATMDLQPPDGAPATMAGAASEEPRP